MAAIRAVFLIQWATTPWAGVSNDSFTGVTEDHPKNTDIHSVIHNINKITVVK